MTIYEELIQRVSNGETFHIDFEQRAMKIGKQKIIDGGKYDENRELINEAPPHEIMDILCCIEELYKSYKYSLPSEKSESQRRKYFKALSIDAISDEQLMIAERREVAQCALEGFILCAILMGNFTWDEDKLGKWFWQSKNDSDLIILKQWIENKNN